MIAPVRSREKQRGVTVVILVGALVLIGAYFTLGSMNFAAIRVQRDLTTTEALLRAKEALVAYAVADENRPGELPCPDVDDDGRSTPGVEYLGSNCASLIGRLPWFTLGLPDLRDDAGERLWYALSNDFRAGGSVALNNDTAFRAGNNALTVTGLQSATNVVAIVFAPGAPVRREGAATLQARSGTAALNAVNYLDLAASEDNSDGNRIFVTAAKSDAFNDRILPVHSDDIMWLVQQRAGREFAQHLREHYDAWQNATTVNGANKGFYPYAGPFTDPSTAQVGTNGTLAGAMPLGASPLVWTSASGICSGVGTAQLDCSTLVICIFGFCIPSISGQVGNVATRFADPPQAADVEVILGLSLGGSATWTLNKPQRRLDFSYGGMVSAGTLQIRVHAPATSSWVGSSWLTENNWHQNAYYALSAGYAIDGVDACGGAAPQCVTVANTAAPNDDKQAVVVMTGRALASPGQTVRPITAPAPMSQFLEATNAAATGANPVFENNAKTAAFNDAPIVVRP